MAQVGNIHAVNVVGTDVGYVPLPWIVCLLVMDAALEHC